VQRFLRLCCTGRGDPRRHLRVRAGFVFLKVLGVDELKSIEQEHKKLTHAEEFIAGISQAINLCQDNESHSATQLLHSANKALEPICNLSETAKEAAILINNAIIQTQEAVHTLNHCLDQTEINPSRLNHFEQRLTQIHDIARKHHINPDDIPARHQALQSEIQSSNDLDEQIQALEAQLTTAKTTYHKSASDLTKSRQKSAKKLSQQVTEQLQTLNMTGGKFNIDLIPQPTDTIHPAGNETIDLLVSANPGQPLQPLTKVASGGELSRISLAIQAITATKHTKPTLIFDEVDAGIGGGTAEVVGQLLKSLGDTAQVLCVTHLPQVAVKGHHHLQVSKSTNNGKTSTAIKPLTGKARINEIARMLGGINITKQTLSHAEEMLQG